MRVRLALFVVVAISLASVLAACGGGSESEGSEASPATTEAAPAEATTAAAETGEEAAPVEETAPAEEISGEITVASWGGAWTDAEKKFFGDPFTEETGVTVNYEASGNTPIATVLLQAESGDIATDVVNADNPEALNSEGLLAEFPPEMMQALEETSQPTSISPHALGLGQTSVIIACNPDVAEKCPTTPAEFWDVEGFPGDRAVAVGLPHPVLAFALIADGVPPDQVYPMDIDRAIAKLEEIKDDVKIWTPSLEQVQQALIDGEVGIAFVPNGIAYQTLQTVPGLELYWDGAMMTNDGLVVMDGGPNKAAALAYVQWIAEHPEAQAGFTEATGYPTPAKDLETLISPELWDVMPFAHDAVPEDSAWLVENMDAVQKAFQEFLAG